MISSFISRGAFLKSFIISGILLLKNNTSNTFHDITTLPILKQNVKSSVTPNVILIGNDFSSASDFKVEFNLLNCIKSKTKFLLTFEWLDNQDLNRVPKHLLDLTMFGLLTFDVFGTIPRVTNEKDYNKFLANQIVQKLSITPKKSVIMLTSLTRLMNISNNIQEINPNLSVETISVGYPNNITDWSVFQADAINTI
jgi:hypothetical protein